jgi:hypothetical protein
MKHLKEIEITVSNELNKSETLKPYCVDNLSLTDMKAYIRALNFCHKLLVKKISYLEKHPDE